MKKIITPLFLFTLFTNVSFAQYFQGSFTNVGNKVTFKIRPNATVSTDISTLEFYIRYNVANTPGFTVSNIAPNTSVFPGLVINQGVGYNDGTYEYLHFAHVSVVPIPLKTYTGGTEYDVVTLTLTGVPATTLTANLELASEYDNAFYYFAINDGAATQVDASASPVTLDQFYGTGFYKVGNANYLPLTNVPLPVKFLGFDVTKKNNTAVLNWSVENEDARTDKYIIEKSANSIDFTALATVSAYNNGRGTNTYSFTQDNISTIRNSGVLYFRIKQIDKDGKYVYTPIKNVRLDGKSFAVNAYPNPVKNITKLTIDLVKDADIIIGVSDGSGRQVKTVQMQGVKGPNFKDLDLSNLASGNYTLKVQSSSEVKLLPIVKAN